MDDLLCAPGVLSLEFLNGNKLMRSRSTGLDNFLSLIEGFRQLLGNFSPTSTTSPPWCGVWFMPGHGAVQRGTVEQGTPL